MTKKPLENALCTIDVEPPEQWVIILATHSTQLHNIQSLQEAMILSSGNRYCKPLL